MRKPVHLLLALFKDNYIDKDKDKHNIDQV